MSHFLEGAITIAFICALTALVIITIVSGVENVNATGLRDLTILLGGALAGSKIPR